MAKWGGSKLNSSYTSRKCYEKDNKFSRSFSCVWPPWIILRFASDDIEFSAHVVVAKFCCSWASSEPTAMEDVERCCKWDEELSIGLFHGYMAAATWLLIIQGCFRIFCALILVYGLKSSMWLMKNASFSEIIVFEKSIVAKQSCHMSVPAFKWCNCISPVSMRLGQEHQHSTRPWRFWQAHTSVNGTHSWFASSQIDLVQRLVCTHFNNYGAGHSIISSCFICSSSRKRIKAHKRCAECGITAPRDQPVSQTQWVFVGSDLSQRLLCNGQGKTTDHKMLPPMPIGPLTPKVGDQGQGTALFKFTLSSPPGIPLCCTRFFHVDIQAHHTGV